MGFNSVFRSLQEVFPQIDVRMLRAVAIEHSKDVDAAVEFILFEVLPSMGNPPEELLTLNDNQEVKYPTTVEAESGDQSFSLMHQEELEEASTCRLSESKSVDCEDPHGTYHTSDSLYVNSSCVDEAEAGSSVSSVHGGNYHDQLRAYTEIEEMNPSTKNQEVNLIVGFHQSPHASSSMTHEDAGVNDHCRDAQCSDIQSLKKVLAYDSVSATCRGNNQSDLCLGANSFKEESLPLTVHIPSPIHEEEPDSMENAGSRNDSTNFVSECEEPGSRGSLQNGSEKLTFDTELVDVENNSQLTTITTRSGQIVSIDLLEDIIRDAKDNKKTLLLAMELVLTMMREVELQEKAAQEAKEEASRGGLDIFAKVEDLRQMLQHAREANDMHAGEVYGEKAILATEARELQSRLLNLSDERDKSLSIIDEMRRDLEARLAAAAAEKAVAEQEKLEKEEAGRLALVEQELIMDKVVEESKKLNQAAEENSKLREFLMNRGHIVDTLQGEIAVICEDVKLLKESIDGRVPFSKSVSSSQTSCILASSSSSFKSLSSDQLLHRSELSESLKTNLEGSESTETDMKKSVGSDRVPSDDEWVLFDNEVLVVPLSNY
eukprot:TRINITY_DN9628_c3_g1_i1.p1 TRINITY_DN9628_c3_g1~~TRINITY_DN9628_c3_g1_i1.p1  ORF type:complete len:604 (+),score=151.82 TRINITY_DN9628_c3_g1_i1:111-1922(+)